MPRSVRHQDILVIGGSGFVGLHVVNRLVGRGLKVTVPVRRRAAAGHLITLPTVDVVEADVHDDTVLDQLLAGRDAVINLVGILQGSRGMPYGPEFARAHVELPRRIVVRCRLHGVRRYLHMSALGADSKGPSMYQRSKGDGEAAVRDSGLDWTIFQPSVIFGPEDRFLNTFAALASIAPVLPIAGAETRFQPICVDDVADAFVNALDEPRTIHKAYELAGPRIYTLRELVQFAADGLGASASSRRPARRARASAGHRDGAGSRGTADVARQPRFNAAGQRGEHSAVHAGTGARYRAASDGSRGACLSVRTGHARAARQLPCSRTPLGGGPMQRNYELPGRTLA